MYDIKKKIKSYNLIFDTKINKFEGNERFMLIQNKYNMSLL